MTTSAFVHSPVMLDEALASLSIRSDGVYLDGTFGRGGHARQILAQLGPQGRLLVNDRDLDAISAARRDFADDPRVRIRHGDFAALAQWDELADGLDGALFDLGVSSPQLDDAARGFSFQADGPLDMRMDRSRGPSAAQWLEEATQDEIADVIYRHGEERMSRRIAAAIVARREQGEPLQTTAQLAQLVADTLGYRERRKHPATRTFQALRIHVNDELQQVVQGLEVARQHLRSGGRLVVISFHSLEDRIVKNFIRDHARAPMTRRGLPPPEHVPPTLRQVGKAQFAGEAELADNPRARSAVLRVAEKC